MFLHGISGSIIEHCHVQLESRKLRKRIKRAVAQGVVSQSEVDIWLFAVTKKGRIYRGSAAEYVEEWTAKEGQRRQELLNKLNAPESAGARAERIEEVGEDTNNVVTCMAPRIESIERAVNELKVLVKEQHTVTVRGQTLSGAPACVTAAQSVAAIASLKVQLGAATGVMKAEAAAAKAVMRAEAATAKAVMKAEKAAATAVMKAEKAAQKAEAKAAAAAAAAASKKTSKEKLTVDWRTSSLRRSSGTGGSDVD